MKAIRIIIVDDQALFREGLRILLSARPDLEVVGEASNGAEALRLAAALKPDVVLLDMQMPVLDGTAAARRLREQHPDIRVIALTTFDDDEYVFECLRAGAVGYLLKDSPSEKVVEAIRAAEEGHSYLQPSIAAKVVAEFGRLSNARALRSDALLEPLSEREHEVLRRIAAGDGNKEIAAKLFIAEGTVKNHVTSILSKLEVRDRTQAAIKAKELGLI